MCGSDGFDFGQITERHRMAAARVDAELYVNTTDFVGAMLLDRPCKFLEIQIALERIIRR
jgi:hypothetical protein